MSSFVDVPDELIESLLKPQKPTFYDEERPEVEVQFCEHCGACENPEACVWGVQCPKCYAPPREQCTNDNGGMTGLHLERHEYAKSPFWQTYRR